MLAIYAKGMAHSGFRHLKHAGHVHLRGDRLRDDCSDEAPRQALHVLVRGHADCTLGSHLSLRGLRDGTCQSGACVSNALPATEHCGLSLQVQLRNASICIGAERSSMQQSDAEVGCRSTT